ncbi:MAG: hypothetical protein IPL61_10850 [Myxococcales bacterium]|nr:hypothetical protein [Myxococcales bacterium]
MIRGALALALVAAVGCRKATPSKKDAAPTAAPDAAPWITPTVVLDRIEVALGSIGDDVISSRELGRQLARCLIEAGDDVVALDRQVPVGRRGLGAAIAVTFDAAPRPDRAAVVVTVAVTLTWRDGDDLPAPRVEVAAEAPVVGARADVAIVAAVERLRGLACTQLAAEVDLLAAADVTAGLAVDDPELQAYALAVIAARRPAGVAAAVVPLLDRPAPIGDAALTTLVALGDPSTVAALTERVDLADATRLTTTIEAAIAIGGPDAEAFLQVLTAHADPDIARHARDGLARMARRAAR